MEHKKELEEKLNEISGILQKEFKTEKDVGVLAGISGIALFHFYYSKYLDIDTQADIGINILEEIIERINNGYQFPTFCSGIAGAGWVFEHLLEEDFMDSENDELLADLDEYLLSVMSYDMQRGQYDFLHAGVGYAFYFLKRYRNTRSDELKQRYREYLNKMVADLEATSQKDENGLKWEAVLDRDTGQRGFNLSLSHGMSSIIIFLSKLYEFDEFKSSTEPLLKGAIQYIRSKELKGNDLYSLYPSWVTEENNDRRSRLAWCYGDLGIGLAFWRASAVLKDEELRGKALNILRHGANRRKNEETGIRDAGICHGSYGNAQIFNRIYKETGEETFREATYYWIDHGLKMAIYEDGNAGYKQWNGMDEDWVNRLSLLEGVAGIGLTIIDYLADFESHWDECLMIS
ncbi:hypothetical protein GWK08_03880 [Leptobacterium flavescens]|uniref:Lanthionine synthetase n=1 Tax=Leptobacterium flavescens TaxID=472055 RepID=A0A6P0UKZ3_9FLAO|nr:lanthionine synthetase C family protein [Leptobacterium flavescens]NER12568.1 hypothetical protein [Leptobacterium flavescens]